MKCPKDESELLKEMYEGIAEIDKCATCQGVWLDEGELEKIQETMRNNYTEELKILPSLLSGAFDVANSKAEKERGCPKCSRLLDKRIRLLFSNSYRCLSFMPGGLG